MKVDLRETLEFADAKLRILLSSHLCKEHGAGECGDVDGAYEALRRNRAALAAAAVQDATIEAVRLALDSRLRDYDYTIRDGTYPHYDESLPEDTESERA